MKIALFWNTINREELETAASIISCKQNDFTANFQSTITCGIFNNETIKDCDNVINLNHKIAYKNEALETPPVIVRMLNAAFQFAKTRDMTYGIFSYNPAWILDPYKLRQLLEKEEVQSKAFSIRMGNIAGKSAKFSPKLPFIDDNFIVFNVKRCNKLGVFDESRLKSFTSHFEMWGGNHIVLLSFFEACVPYSNIFVYSDGRDCQGLYGKFNNFYPDDYLFSHKYGFLSINSCTDSRIHSLRAELLSQLNIKGNSVLDMYIKRYKKKPNAFYSDQHIPFLKAGVLRRIFDIFLNIGNRYLNKINYEFLRQWHDHKLNERKSG